MIKITDRIGFRQFLARIFISQSGVSSRRVGGFISLISVLFLVFFKYPMEYINVMALLTIGFFGLTTISSALNKSNGEEQNNVNINKG
jgi:hypothetical protein